MAESTTAAPEIICSICLSVVKQFETMTATTPCNHTLHFACAIQLAQKNTLECPTCRRSLPDLRIPRAVAPNPTADNQEVLYWTNRFHNLAMAQFENRLIQISIQESNFLPCHFKYIPATGPAFFLQDLASQKFLHARSNSSIQSQPYFVEECDADESSLWRFEADGHLVHDTTDLCIEPGAGDDTPGRNLWLWTMDQDPWQGWHRNTVTDNI